MVQYSNYRFLFFFLFSILFSFLVVFLIPIFIFDAHERFGYFYIVLSSIIAPVIARSIFVHFAGKNNGGNDLR